MSHNVLCKISNELGKLAGIGEVIDMPNIEIKLLIASEFGAFKEYKILIYMVGNKDMSAQASFTKT